RAIPRSRSSSSAAARIASRPPEGGRPRRFGVSGDGSPGIGYVAYWPRIRARRAIRVSRFISVDPTASGGGRAWLERPGPLGLRADEVALPDQRKRQHRAAERNHRSDQQDAVQTVDEPGPTSRRGELTEWRRRRVQRRRDLAVAGGVRELVRVGSQRTVLKMADHRAVHLA